MNRIKALHILQSAKRIGIIRTDRLGDMVLTLPLANALRHTVPTASIEMIARRYATPLLENSPILGCIHYTDEQPLRDILLNHKFDVLFFPRMKRDECYAAFRAGVSLRVGSGYRWYSILLNYRIQQHRKIAERHEAEYNVGMLDSIIGTTITPELVRPYISQEQRSNMREILTRNGVNPDNPYLMVHPGSGGSSRDWPSERFGKTAQHIAQLTRIQVVVTGVESEAALCQSVVSHCKSAINLCGKCNLYTMIALLEKAKLLLANSTGVLHIACSLQTPVVGLYPNTAAISAKRWGPYSQPSRVLSPLIGDDMSAIEVDAVVQAALELIR